MATMQQIQASIMELNKTLAQTTDPKSRKEIERQMSDLEAQYATAEHAATAKPAKQSEELSNVPGLGDKPSGLMDFFNSPVVPKPPKENTKKFTPRGRLEGSFLDLSPEEQDKGILEFKAPKKETESPAATSGFGSDNIPLQPGVTEPWTGSKPEEEPPVDTGTTDDTGTEPDDPKENEPEQPLTLEDRAKRLSTEWEGREQEFDTEADELDKTFAQSVKEIKGMYSALQADADKKRMWEQLINGLSHIAAGVVGMQTGLNLGGIKFDKRDWDAEKDRLMAQHKAAKEDVYRNLNTRQRTLANKRAQSYRNYKMKRDDIQQAFQNAATTKTLNLKERDQKIQWFKAMSSGATKGDKALEKISDKLNAEVINELDKGEGADFDKVLGFVKAANARAGRKIFGEPQEVARTIFGVDTGFKKKPQGTELVEPVLIPGSPSANQTQMPPAKPGYTLKKDKQGDFWYVNDKDPSKGMRAN